MVFTYPLFFKFLFRFGNIPVTFFLLGYMVPALVNLDKDMIYLIPIIISLLLIYFINKHYLLLYKILPYTIVTDEEKLIGKNFLFSNKEVIIYFQNIVSLEGGIFAGKPVGLMKVLDGQNKYTIGFYSKLMNVQKLTTLILSKVNKDVYEQVINKAILKKKQ
jgi:hypothetical protein